MDDGQQGKNPIGYDNDGGSKSKVDGNQEGKGSMDGDDDGGGEGKNQVGDNQEGGGLMNGDDEGKECMQSAPGLFVQMLNVHVGFKRI